MRTKKVLYNFLLIVILFLIGYLVYHLTQDTTTNKTKVENSNYPGVDLITDVTENEKYHIAMHYPEFTSEELNEEIEEYISELEKEFLAAVHDNKWHLKNHTANLSLTMDIHLIGENIYSIVFSEASYVTGANAQQKAKVYLVDIDKGKYIQGTEIFNDTKQNREELYSLLIEGFKESAEYGSLLLEEALKEWTMNEENDFSNLYFTEKSAVYKFDKYEVTAGAAGMPEISIPLEKMRKLLTDEWKDKLLAGSKGKDEKDNSNTQIEEKKPDKSLPTSAKKVALTFDDGPHPKNTIEILDLLDQYDAKATFFMLGNRVDFYPDIAKMVADRGHEIGNHTWNHKDLTTLNKEEVTEEFKKTNEIIRNATGIESTVFRPPYGAVNEEVQTFISSRAVFWTIDTLDWKSHNTNEILKIVQENVKDGSIILMHDIHATSVQALEPVLKYLKAEGYELVTVSEL